MKKQLMTVTLLGPYTKEVIPAFTNMLAEFNCNVNESNVSVLGQNIALMMQLSGHWGDLAKLETALPQFSNTHQLQTCLQRTEVLEFETPMMPYLVHIIAMDGPGILSQVSQFFLDENIYVSAIAVEQYTTQTTQTPMSALCYTINIPSDISLSELREHFIAFCDEINIDAVMEPCKS